MESFSTAVSIFYQFATNGAFLLLSALGLIVILGMMNIINLAHGELMMMGAYTATLAYHQGLPFPLCAVLAFFVVGAFGAVLERTIVRRFYGRELGALVVTWGIGLTLSQGTLMVFGPFLPAIALAYMAFTLDSAYQYARKRGGLWKGRVQSNVNGVR